MVQILTKGFYAIHREMTAVKIAIACVCLNVILNVILIWTPLKTSGLAWSTAICAVIQVILLLIFIRKHTQKILDRSVLSSWLRTSIITLAMGFIVWELMSRTWVEGGTWEESLLTLGVTVSIGVITFVICSLVLRMKEFWWAIGKSE